MAATIDRRTFLMACGAAGAALLAAGCSNAGDAGSPAASDVSEEPAAGASASRLTVGTLATEDILPFWVAAEEGLDREAGLELNVEVFQSATELIAGVASGAVDLAMTDVMVTASMFAGGVGVQILWVTLGVTPDQGRFGIMVGPDSDVTELAQLAGVPIGVGSNTILEYVMDGLMAAAGVPEEQVVVEELQKLPVRYQAMASGEVAAAALPGTLLALGEASGCKLVADDTSGENLSQSVMVARQDVLADQEKSSLVEIAKDVWDAAAARINADPEACRPVLVANANLPEEIAQTYPICSYPTAQLPDGQMVEAVLAWMERKGYLAQPVSYDEATGAFSLA